METTEYTDEDLNYFRLCYVFTHNVPEGMRTVFKQQWNARYKPTYGEWLDVPKNATDFCNMESPRNQRRNASLLTIMANGNTKEWDCTCLFYALLFSDCLGSYLNVTTVWTNVNELRKIRNKAFAHTPVGKLTDVDFEDTMLKVLAAFKALGLDTTKVNEVKTQKGFPTEELSSIQQQLNNERKLYVKFHSFCVLPPKPSHHTTDRADEVTTINHEMEKLRSTKKSETTVIYLSGNPGCGKSEIARQIGNSYFNEIPEDTTHLKFVFTFNASNIDTLLGSYVDFAARLGCDEDSVTRIATSNDLRPEEKIKNIKSVINPKVQIYSSWLIIVDNVNDLKSVSNYLPQAGEKTSGDGQILVTTQDSQSIPLDSYTYHYSSLKVGMQKEDTIALLSQISGTTGDRDTLLNIASALDFQPLALACAAIYVQRIFNSTDQPKTKWENYLLKLQEGKREATEDSYKQTSSTYELSMTAAVRLALERVVIEDKIMMHAFQFLSVIANEPIPLKYVVQYVMSCMPDKDQDAVAAHISLSSLVILSEDVEISQVIRVHQVVYHGLQKLLDDDKTDISKLMSVFSDLVSFKNVYDVTKAEIIATRSFTTHFVVLSRKLNLRLLDHSTLPAKSLNAADCLFKAGSICLVQGSYGASEIFLEICLSIQQRSYHSGPEMAQDQNFNSDIAVMSKSHKDKESHFEGKLSSGDVSIALATTLKRLSDLYIDLENYKKAQIHLEEALVIEEKLHRGDHPELAITLKNLGVCLMHLGQHEKAEAYLQRALAMQEKCQGENNTLLADILIILVISLQSHGEFEKAKTYCERALEIEQQLRDSEYVRVADTINDLGVCLSNFKDEKKATTFYKEALRLTESVYHKNHPYKAITLRNIGVSLRKLRENETSKRYFEKALTIYETGNDQNNTQLMLNSLGSCLIELKEYDKAKAYLERALSIREKGDNENDSQLATTLNNLGFCHYGLKQYDKAKVYLVDTVDNLGFCHYQLKEYDKARAYYERALSIREKRDNENDPQLPSTLNNLGFCHYGLKQYDKAKVYLEKALSIREKGDHENDPQLATTLEILGFCHYQLKEYDKAKAYLERALSIREKGDNENDSQLATTLNDLGFCLNELKQHEKAKLCLERALTIREKGNNKNDSQLASTLENLGFCLNKLEKYKAKVYLDRALFIYEKGDDEL
ncbi:uncharacterized protein LOC116298544 isoform X3 [Actinia tenebrosa]|uniref:Uncharacterized protein LOC116298544 isoform X3 n=1 Tax=Actinia tenebrosa TaxID=6105 RepID=A0A6P8I2Y7_ACTTE|nr:uncharacterized protein LOC116298544 isoform X3 [Actinia tenebrosa]